jgi:DNA repair protein RadC
MHQNLFLSNVAEIQLSYSTKVKPSDRAKITCSKDGAELFRQIFPDFEHREYFYVMLLNRGNRVLGFYQISVGGISGTVVDVKLILQAAIKSNSSGILLGHYVEQIFMQSNTDICKCMSNLQIDYFA